jgi:hypothetical protein
MCGNSGNETTLCICATTIENNPICFDKNAYRCNDTTLLECDQTDFGPGGCPIGNACVASVCNCGSLPPRGICVRTSGCGDGGVEFMGELMKIGEMEKRRRTFRK